MQVAVPGDITSSCLTDMIISMCFCLASICSVVTTAQAALAAKLLQYYDKQFPNPGVLVKC